MLGFPESLRKWIACADPSGRHSDSFLRAAMIEGGKHDFGFSLGSFFVGYTARFEGVIQNLSHLFSPVRRSERLIFFL